ncbi:hypothetical protein SUFG_00045 [Sulfitobacter phage phiCB2047-B]|uniref:Uncharacterized protein n=1 Tax=Sulfitobacter phage phiCB2047-B TaxID=754046 RepID=M4PMT4_9CAUD|nr:hypothetical protein SUFG_00045 [Sulfitobacter phage phiCB2047-B]AGH07412.1 hypothetical protein SUFG_00045 [Sulfitobacter phage phiCB2047-B]
MTDLSINAILGPRYEIVIQQPSVEIDKDFNLTLHQSEPMRLMVGTGWNGMNKASSGTVDVTVIADQTLNAFRAVGYNGRFTDPTYNSLSQYAGVSRMATVAGEAIKLVRQGLMEESGWNWEVNKPIFISTQGVLTQTLPMGIVRRIGWAISPTKVNLEPYPIIGV